MQTIAIAIGGALGAMLRFWVSNVVYGVTGTGFPYGTLVVNIAGSLFMGFIYILLLERVADAVIWRSFLLIGVLGAFTTFSTFSIETLNLIQSGEYIKSLANVLVSVLACLLAAWSGIMIGKNI